MEINHTLKDHSSKVAAVAASSDKEIGTGDEYTLLFLAVTSLPHEELKDLVRKMLISSSEARDFLRERLIVTVDQVPSNTNTTAVKNTLVETGTMVTAESKQVLRYRNCENCNEHYDVSNNSLRSCTFHPGTKVVDDDSELWDQYDLEPWRDGSPEDYADDEEFAEGFEWTCCKRRGDADGCVTKMHEPVELEPDNPTKRRRVE